MIRLHLPLRFIQGILLLLVIWVTLYAVFILLNKEYGPLKFLNKLPPSFVQKHPYFHYDMDSEEPQSSDMKCLLPRIHPFDPSIWGYIGRQRSVFCKHSKPQLTYIDNNGKLRYNKSDIQMPSNRIHESLECYWSSVYRGEPNAENDDSVVFGNKVPFKTAGAQFLGDSDFIRVQCKASNFIYDTIQAHIRNISDFKRKPLVKFTNVLLFGIDSMSRQAVIRYLPRTYGYLSENLKMIVLRGMNKVGDNSYPNLIPVLTGLKAHGGGLNESIDIDEWPLITKAYSSQGYATLWAEDMHKYALFNYFIKGFRHPPTHHYLRPFWIAVEQSPLNKESSSMCYGRTPRHVLQIEYVRRFVSTYKKKSIPFFGFSFLAELSHDTLPLISAADGHIEEFLKFLNDEGFLENTVLIVFSDHGHRFDNIRKTPIGAIEERMPFFSIRIPNYISSLQPEILENLWVNSGRLVVPFDIHATLMDILEFAVTGRPLGQSKPPEGDLGQSLFVEVPPDRTCINASVPDHYCVCEIASAIPVTDTTARSAAKATIDRINAMLHGEGPYIKEKCATLVLAAIRSAHILRKAEEEATPSPSTKVRIIIEAKPSKGIFEATVSVADDVAEVLGDISRINTFGSQSNCIRHWTLRKYCFCNN
ncbi:uncharacterized protein LOC118196175 isoform X2 [Stegodyphus dumicola]|uniref:uncharacterized protein LOC118196175 isoform X2 n=1 Tax=Stegodyphus dumicola TaxID=202533 RepID=UPI0015AE33A8|nr:uncharacterized protein LOC118196175 isoform X2 [Stegodyphus dumicola]